MLSKTDKILIICESPNKVKTILNILKNAGYSKASVVASVGHIMTLGNGGTAYNSGISPEQNFKMNLEIAEGKKEVIENIKNQAKKFDKIFIMTDGDREGEVISWSLLKFCELPKEKCFRVIAHEITSKAIITALENPVPFNNDLVNAGLSRMMLDKLIGFGLSPLGKKYIGAKSIGRCQSVGLLLLSNREKEINDFVPELYFNLYLNFSKNLVKFKAKYAGYKQEKIDRLDRQADVDAIIKDCSHSDFLVDSIQTVVHKESPKPPFCTATFQQEAASKLSLKVKDAMHCAQKLFEGININGEHKGLITYMRTDSTEIAKEFLPELKTFIESSYGKNSYAGPVKTKKKSTDQDGHEALRVVDVNITPDLLATYINNNLLLKVYKLIWQRTIASVMVPAEITETVYNITNNEHIFKLSLKELLNSGYKAVYEFDEPQEFCSTKLLEINEILQDTSLESVKKFTQPKPRYTEASLVKELQQKEIGRPSTYATIIETILNPSRGYASLDEKYIVPTDRGIQLADYCNRAFSSVINLNYTKELEHSLDKIANGKIMWLDFMENFYKHLNDIITNTEETGLASDMPEKECPLCGSPMVIRRSRFGRLFYGCSKYPKCRGILNIN
jgi:DNA topoisomerase-1